MLIKKSGLLVVAIFLLAACNLNRPRPVKDPTAHIKLELGPGLQELIKTGRLTVDSNGVIRLKVTSTYSANIEIGVVETYYDSANVKLGESPFGELKVGPGETAWYNTWSSGVAPTKEIHRVVLTRKR